jgi:serine/threonine protein kinase
MDDTLTERYKKPTFFQERKTAFLRTANDLHTHQSVLLKFPAHPKKNSERERIKREARAYRLLSGVPGVPKFLGYEENEGHPLGPFFAMELLAGKTLSNYLEKRALPESQAIEVAQTLCQILEEIHARGIVHRDISIDNVLLLDGTKEARLIDFGLALIPNEAGAYDSYDAGRVGTYETRAPEVLDSFPGDARSDIYSLGKLLYQMANGLEDEAVQKMPGLSPEAVSRVSKALSAVIAGCTHKHPDDRYQSVLELDKALADITEQEPAKTPPTLQQVGTSSWFGAFLLVGVASSLIGVASSVFAPRLSWETPTPPATSPTSVEQPPTPTIVTPATIPSLPPSPSSVPVEAPQPSSKQTTPRPTAKPLVQAPHTETAKDIIKETPVETAPKPLTEEEEIDELTRKKALKYATQPIALPTQQPIDIIIKK